MPLDNEITKPVPPDIVILNEGDLAAPEKKEPEPLPILNNQPDENKVNKVSHVRDGIEIVDIWLTIQGEGPLHGKPAVFIRTAGCNLSSQCKGCDTDYTTDRRFVPENKIVEQVQALRAKCLVVITGGEPLRQNIGPLIRLLLNTGYKVQLETNGTFHWDKIPWEKIMVVCSPKTPKIIPAMIPCVDCYKYVLTAGEISEEDGLPTSVLGSGITPARPHSPNVPVYVSPADEQDEKKNEANLRATIISVFNFDYTLSTQDHKEWGLK